MNDFNQPQPHAAADPNLDGTPVLDAALVAAEAADDTRLLVAIHFELGRVFEQIGEPAQSLTHFRAAAQANVGS